jgi:uncharacterized protein YbjT (DUF2867 family)
MLLSPNTGARTRGDVLITGATGFLGMELMARLLEHGDRRVWALVRAPDEAGAADRLHSTLSSLVPDPDRYLDRSIGCSSSPRGPTGVAHRWGGWRPPARHGSSPSRR